MSHQPWDNWRLDAKFLVDLDRWAAQNPETSLDKVLKQICDAIEQGKEFLEAIPDGVLPARGLVKSLAHLIRFGKVFATAKAEVHSFAVEVVQWVMNIQRAFSAGRKNWMKGHFTRTTWRNLERIRDIIDEICKWAAARLSDKRWSLIAAWNKLHVSAAIEAFKRRISEARTIFNEAAIIHQSRAIDAILHMIGILTKGQRKIVESQRAIEKMLLDIQMTQTEQFNEIITRLDMVDTDVAERHLAATIEKRRQFVEQMLSRHTIANPTYTDQEKSPCDEGTRVDVLAAIDRWVRGIDSGSQNFFWLSGNPGCGKSAITASLTKHSKVKDILWAQLFINRNNPETTNPNKYFPTIAHQLAQRSEDVEREIHDQLKANHALLDGVSSEQAPGLFIDAVRVASRLTPNKPIVIVIDGLDETDRRHLRSIAVIFAQLFNSLPDCPNVKVFISSRTDNDIQTPFAETILGSTYVRNLHLDTDHPSSIRDVTMYLRRHIAQIVLDHNLDWNEWPGDQAFDLLAKHASGLFIWAATAVKFFRQQIEDWGRERLIFLLDDLNSKGMVDINTLYGFIIITTYKNQMNDEHDSQWACETFRRLVGSIVVLYEPLSINDLSMILNLRQTPSSPAVDVIQFIKRLRTVLVAGAGIIHGKTIPRLHKSFFEFITSNRVDVQFRVDVDSSHCELGIQCLLQLPLAKSVISRVKIPLVYRYACRFWSQHLTHQIPEIRSGILVPYPLNTLNIHDIGTLLQRSSRKPGITPISLTISSSSVVASVLGRSCGWDIKHGLAQGGASLQVIKATNLDHQPTPHYYYRRVKDYNMPRKHRDSTRRFTEWSIHKPPLIGALPPDRQRIHYATSCSDIRGYSKTRQIGLWDPKTMRKTTFATSKEGESARSGSTFQSGHFAEATSNSIHIRSIQTSPLGNGVDCKSVSLSSKEYSFQTPLFLALSPTGQFLAVSFHNGSLHFWNISDGVFTPAGSASLSVDHSRITAVVFSGDGSRALSCSEKGTQITLWVADKGKFHPTLSFRGGPSVPYSAAFSPDGMTALSGHHHGVICFWDVFTGTQSSLPLKDPTQSRISVLQYSDDGESIISGTYHGQLTLWDAESRCKIASFDMVNPLKNGVSACFLSGGQLCGATPYGMKVFDIRGKYTELKHGRESGAGNLGFTSFSPSGVIQVLSPSSDGKIRLRSVNYQEKEGITLESKGLFRFRTCAFSPDGARVAASSENGTIYLWDTGTGKLIASSRSGATISAFAIRKAQGTDMFFAPDNKLVTVSGEKVLLWEATKRKLTCVPTSLPSPSPFFDESDYDLDSAITRYNARWIPSRHKDSGLWVLIGDHVIHAQQDGTLIIAQLDTVSEKD